LPREEGVEAHGKCRDATLLRIGKVLRVVDLGGWVAL
jgi:hypothetical protein